MNPLLRFMINMPFQLLVGSAALLLKTAEDLQHAVTETASVTLSPQAATSAADALPGLQRAGESDLSFAGDPITRESFDKEPYSMSDYEFSDGNNDSLKEVKYTIRFRKRDFEAMLQPEREEVIDYPLNTFCNLKIAEFLQDLSNKGKELPSNWENGSHPLGDYGYSYPEGQENPDRYSSIPTDELKWLECDARVSRTLDKAEQEYDKEQARAQQRQAERQDEMVNVLKDISRKLG